MFKNIVMAVYAMGGQEILSDLILFAKNEPQLALGIAVVGAIIVLFFVNVIGGDKK